MSRDSQSTGMRTCQEGKEDWFCHAAVHAAAAAVVVTRWCSKTVDMMMFE